MCLETHRRHRKKVWSRIADVFTIELCRTEPISHMLIIQTTETRKSKKIEFQKQISRSSTVGYYSYFFWHVTIVVLHEERCGVAYTGVCLYGLDRTNWRATVQASHAFQALSAATPRTGRVLRGGRHTGRYGDRVDPPRMARWRA